MILPDAFNFDLVGMLFCLRKVIFHLQAILHFGGTAEPLFQPDRHFLGNTGLLVDQIVQGLPLHAKRTRGCGHGQAERCNALLPNNAAAWGGFFKLIACL